MSEKLAACPFCGSTNVHTKVRDDDVGHRLAVVACHDCGGNGPPGGWKQTAVELWNARRRSKKVRITREQELNILCRRLAKLYGDPAYAPLSSCFCADGLECSNLGCAAWWRMLFDVMDANGFAKMVHLYLLAKEL